MRPKYQLKATERKIIDVKMSMNTGAILKRTCVIKLVTLWALLSNTFSISPDACKNLKKNTHIKIDHFIYRVCIKFYSPVLRDRCHRRDKLCKCVNNPISISRLQNCSTCNHKYQRTLSKNALCRNLNPT